METIYLGIIIFLFVLAIFDLSVGVSNDAVNFLNSAVGAKAARVKTIILVAAIGVFCGAAMSNGMMDIARHGIFRPEQFYFNDIMCIFLAVMVTDVVLLDVFNTLGMPTSTTVSMVFELLGGTFVLALLKIAADETGMLGFDDLLNTEKALSVIFGIFLSVAIAFFFGTLVQWLSRILFTFNYRPRLKWTIGLFGGVAATAIIYFMLIKGLKDSSFMTPENKGWVAENTWMIVSCCFLFFTILMQILHWCRVNVFKVIVLMGTFALAMAFAGNDLVNFIGVPLAGLDAYQDFIANGAGNPKGFLMESLNGSAKTPLVFLIGAGVIMVTSLATSKKAKNVIKTSVNLSRQDEGEEMFGSSAVARSLVRSTTNGVNAIIHLVPQNVRTWINNRFNKDEVILADGAAFDLVRASVNLVLAGLLIALGTSLKLPLSTTYVTFMVAMGTSLADRAWTRESAVFRITGMLSVIGGWFITAGAAFILSALVVVIMYYGGFIAMGCMIALAVFLLVRSNIAYRKKQQDLADDDLFKRLQNTRNKEEAWQLLSLHVMQNLSGGIDFVVKNYTRITNGFMEENLKHLRKSLSKVEEERKMHKRLRRRELIGIRKIDKVLAMEKNTWFHLGSNSSEQMLYCLKRMAEPCLEHVDNHFQPLPEVCVNEFIPLRDTLLVLMTRAENAIKSGIYGEADRIRQECSELKREFSQLRQRQFDRVHEGNSGSIEISLVYLNLLQESEELASSLRHILRANDKFQGVTK
ncbi:MAG: inorganic phosphate transporter [Bacteroidaceae bacterium]|nr:inorganic phosphate transporter [Bacteroidaceae bacterium]